MSLSSPRADLTSPIGIRGMMIYGTPDQSFSFDEQLSCGRPAASPMLPNAPPSTAWTYEVLEVVVVEPAAGLLAKPSFLDVPAQQGARSFRHVSRRGRVVFLDVENDIQSDLVH
jgi:hypothetical protein